MDTQSPTRRLFARVLRSFAQVRPDEVVTVSVMMLGAFLLLSAYYLLKTVREPLILLEGGAEVKLYARAAQAVLMVGVVQVYGEIAKRVGRTKLLAIVFLFFVSNLLVFAILSRTNVRIGLAFFLWVGVFSYTAVAQFWGLAADIYSEDQGKRLFPVIGMGSSVGAVAGSRLAKSLVPFGSHALMGTAALLIVVCMGLLAWVDHRAGVDGRGPPRAQEEEPLAGEYVFDRTILAAVQDSRATGAAAQDTIAVRVGAILSGTVVWLGGRLHLPLATFVQLNVVFTALWIGVVLAIGKEHARRSLTQ